MQNYPASGEINRKVNDAPRAVISLIEQTYREGAVTQDHADRLSMEFGTWRFNLRSSNTEPLLRLNVESTADEHLMLSKTAELLERIGGESTDAA